MENDVFSNYWMDPVVSRFTKSGTSHVHGNIRREHWGEHSNAAPAWSICSVGVTGGLKPDVGTLVPLQSTQTAAAARGDDRGSVVQKLLMLLSHSQKTKGDMRHVWTHSRGTNSFTHADIHQQERAAALAASWLDPVIHFPSAIMLTNQTMSTLWKNTQTPPSGYECVGPFLLKLKCNIDDIRGEWLSETLKRPSAWMEGELAVTH